MWSWLAPFLQLMVALTFSLWWTALPDGQMLFPLLTLLLLHVPEHY